MVWADEPTTDYNPYVSPSPLADSQAANTWVRNTYCRQKVKDIIHDCIQVYNTFGDALRLARSAATEADQLASTVWKIAGAGTVIAGAASFICPFLAPVAKAAAAVTAEALMAEGVANEVLGLVKSLSDGPYHDLGKAIDGMQESGILPAQWQNLVKAVKDNLVYALQSIVWVTRAKERIKP
jgi:hypothetical protein